MIIIPLIYFTLLTLVWWKRHQGLDVCVYMSGLYAVTLYCGAGVLLSDDMLGEGGILFEPYNLELGLLPTLLFCVLITLGALPFSLIYNKEIKSFKAPKPLFLDCFCWLLFFVFLLNFYLVADSTAEILSGDLSTVRSDHSEGILSPAEIKANSLPIIFRYILYLNHTTILALPLFFHYSCSSGKPWWFKVMLIATSLTKPIAAIQAADRTEFTFYVMMFVFCLIFYWHQLSNSFKRRLMLTSSPFAVIILLYLVVVSQARFGGNADDTEKTYEGAIEYAGQNYLNFCYFWEYGNFEKLTLERTLPFSTYVVLKVESNADRRSERSAEQGFFMSVFASYIGDVMLDLSPQGAVLWAAFFFLLCISVIRYSHPEELDVGDALSIFVLAAIPIFGIFYYRYYSPQYIYLFLSVIVINIIEKKQFKYE